MTFGFLNAAMLFGLAAVSLPVIAHLLSKRRYDVVDWGAMRFLQLGNRTRRRIQFQDLLLLLLRMALVACVALAMARPWGRGGLLSAVGDDVRRDVVIILDDSTSMAWRGGRETPRQWGIQWIHESLELLKAGDTLALIDARGQPRRAIFPPTSDQRLIRETLERLPPPGGLSDLPAALADAQQILATTKNPSREVIVLTDQQALPWRLDDESAWTRIADLRLHSPVVPNLNVASGGDLPANPVNFSLGPLVVSQEVTVPDYPLRIRGALRQSGGSPTTRRVSFLIDGQPVVDKEQEVHVAADGESPVELETAFAAPGAYVVSLELEEDDLLPDNRAAAVILVRDGLPVLIVDGDPRLDDSKSESFFLRSAFSATGQVPWVRARTVRPQELTGEILAGERVVMLCNVESLEPTQWQALRDWVTGGGSLVIAPGDKVDAARLNDLSTEQSFGLAARMEGVVDESSVEGGSPVTVDSLSLSAPWLRRFQRGKDLDFSQTRFSKWWQLQPIDPAGAGEAAAGSPSPGSEVLARLSTGAPLMVSRRVGEGQILQLAVPLDADWSTLPAKNDFVPFVHELVFALTAGGEQRNVPVGASLVRPMAGEERVADYEVLLPDGRALPAEVVRRGPVRMAVFRETLIPGQYEFRRRDGRGTPEPYIVRDDGSESNLAVLTSDDWDALTGDHGLRRIEEMREVVTAAKRGSSRAEFGWLLLAAVVVLLVAETALTRRMVQGGHFALEGKENSEEGPTS